MDKVTVTYQATLQPQTMRFSVDRMLTDNEVVFADPLLAQRSPLASKLFGFPWCQAVGIGPNYVLVTRQNWVGWDVLADPLSELIAEHLQMEIPIFSESETEAGDRGVDFRIETTPNPNALKFVASEPIATESAYFADATKAERCFIAREFLSFPWCSGVYIGLDFVTLNRNENVGWESVAEPARKLLMDFLATGRQVLEPADTLTAQETDSAVIQQIKQVIREEIRPGVLSDGGDIVFVEFKDQTVYIKMQGSCSGCPSSRLTLKNFIETRLAAAVKEVRSVVQL